jgi:hypothetical protein
VPEFELQDSPRNGSTPVLPPVVERPASTPADERVVLTGYLREIDQYYAMVKMFEHQEPDEAILACSGISARLTEMRGLLWRSGSARATQLRTREVDPLLDEVREQFKYHSRLLEFRKFDWQLSGGQH